MTKLLLFNPISLPKTICHVAGLTSKHSSSRAKPVFESFLIFDSSLLHLPPTKAVLNLEEAHFNETNPLMSSG